MGSKGLIAALTLSLLSMVTAPAGGQTPCEMWSMATVASGLDRIENLEPDGTGGMLISSGPRSAIERLTRDGATTTVAKASNPGGLRVRGRKLFAVTGTNVVDGATNRPTGTVEKIDLRKGDKTTYSAGLTSPNGLVFDGNGNAYVSRDGGSLVGPDPWVPNPFSGGIGTEMYVTKIPATSPLQPDTKWAALPDTNGLAVDSSNTWLYAATTFNFNASVYRILLTDPSQIQKVADLGSVTDPANGLDDMTFGTDGNLYLTANGMGRIWQLDPETGERCVIAAGLQNPTAVKFGRGPGWPSDHLFVSGWDGEIRELSPPA
jgi:sugar lactone lactonase YvrE